jgi:SAM-dependent methyltransferase
MNKFTKDRLVCPTSKLPFVKQSPEILLSQCGFQYKNCDFRVGLEFSKDWSEGQKEYEVFEKKWLEAVNQPKRLVDLDDEVADVYEKIRMQGDILDVGGAYGFVVKQAGLDPDHYVSIDPINMDWQRLVEYKHFASHYAICKDLPRIRGFAEFLPFSDSCFDFIHMRSCIDHFANPNLALREAFRVLRRGGKLVVGISLEGSYKRNLGGAKGLLKRLASKSSLVRQIVEVAKNDHHMFHPTMSSLFELIKNNGFAIEQEVWQQAYHNVIYLQAVRLDRFPTIN